MLNKDHANLNMNGLLVETPKPFYPFPIRIPSHHHYICILNFSAIQAKQAVTANQVQNFLAFFLLENSVKYLLLANQGCSIIEIILILVY